MGKVKISMTFERKRVILVLCIKKLLREGEDMRENPKPFEVYKHFKGNMYQILTLATDSEDGSLRVVYQAMYGDFKVYVRDLEMFMSETDTCKYPDCNQKYRFEKVESGEQILPEIQVEDVQPDAGVLEYLDARTVDERINILASMHHRLTDDMLRTMAVVTDVELNEGSTEQKYQELKNCLLMKQKFEKQRY